MSLAVVLSMMGVAFADDIGNQIDLTVDATLENINLTVGGPSGNVTFLAVPKTGTNSDGSADPDNGCNFDAAGQNATFNVVSSNPGAVTVSPSTITFTGPGCNDNPAITVTAVAVGSATITLTPNSNTSGGTFNLAPAAFTVNVAPAVPVDSSAPVITPTVTPAPNAAGWNNTDVTVIWTVNDPESTITSTTGCTTSVLTSETSGTTLTCSATSAGGTSSQSVTIKIDKTAPVITGDADPDANGAGWNNTPVTVSFACAEAGLVQSGIATDTVAGDTLSTDGADQSVTNDGDCIDVAGNSAVPVTIGPINIDQTGPTITGSATPAANSNGWNNADVIVSFTCTPNLAPIVTDTVAGATLTVEGAGQSVTNTGDCVDAAGNTADSATVSGINIDKTAPVVTGSRTPAANANGWNNTDVTVSFACTDALSGVDVNTLAGATLSSDGAGQSVSNTGSCTDKAGNTNAGPVTVSGINIDKTAPVVVITTPANGATYTFGAVVNANWSVSDALSGIDGSLTTSTTANGAAISTTPISAKTYTVSATDLAGNVTTVTNNYTIVGYDFSKCFLQPISLTWKDFQKLSTIPAKCPIVDTLGNPITNATMQLYVDNVAAVSSGTSNTGNWFRYSPIDRFYIYNLSTKMPVLTIGSHTLKVVASDGTTHTYTNIIKIK